MKKVLLWVLAFLLTAFTAVYQHKTGPTYRLRGEAEINNTDISYKLARSHESTSDCEINISVPNPDIKGYVVYKKHKTTELWTQIPMARQGNSLIAYLPKEPPAGKLDYKVILTFPEGKLSLTGEKPVVIRFKGEVPGLNPGEPTIRT